MRLATALLIGATVAGVTGLALAAGPAFHEMTVAMPNGGTAHIRYVGNVPPKINFVSSGPAMTTGFEPAFMPVSPFVEIAAMQAQMDRQMAAMMLQARQLQAAALRDPLYSAALNGQAPADNGMRFVAVAPGSSYCFRSMAITASPNGGAPKVVSHTEGNCGATPSPQKPAVATAPAAEPAAPLQTISYKAPVPVHPRPGI